MTGPRSLSARSRAGHRSGWGLALFCCLVAAPIALAQEPPADAKVNPFQKDETDRAVDKAVAWLLRQQAEDGSIDKDSRGRKGKGGIASNSTAMTSLAIMSMASVGHEPGDKTPEGQALRKALTCVLEPRRQRKDGYLGGEDGSRMYGHGITTLMLAEMLGMGVDEEMDKQIRARLKPALDLILRSQKLGKEQRFKGGWRYEPESRDADLSVSVWQVMALRSARNAGLDIPKEAIDQAADYIRRSYPNYRPEQKGQALQPAGFSYQPDGQGKYAMAAAGLLAMQVCGFYDDPTVRGSADWLLANKPAWESEWVMYGTYYYAQGMYQRGGKHADEARKIVQSILLPRQAKDGEQAGSWDSHYGEERNAGRVYSTSMAILSLSVKHHYLPIYQR